MENKNKRPRFIQMEKNDIDSMMTDNNNNNQLPDSNNNSNNSKQQKSSSSKIVSTWEEFFEDPINTELHSELINNFIDEETVLTQAIKNSKIRVVERLLELHADPNLLNRKGVTPISTAAHKGNLEIMSSLIRHGASVNSLNVSGSTALIQASHFGHVDAVKLLLENNAMADFFNLKGTTALMRASQEGHSEISKLLINAGADVNKKNNEGMNALMLASQRGHAAMVLLLIKSPCAMDEQTQQGSTALMLACKRGHDECVKMLVAMGAEIFIRDNRGRTARDTAMRRNHGHLLDLLDTQAQIRLHRQFIRLERRQLFNELRDAAEVGRVRLDREESDCINLVRALRDGDESVTSALRGLMRPSSVQLASRQVSGDSASTATSSDSKLNDGMDVSDSIPTGDRLSAHGLMPEANVSSLLARYGMLSVTSPLVQRGPTGISSSVNPTPSTDGANEPSMSTTDPTAAPASIPVNMNIRAHRSMFHHTPAPMSFTLPAVPDARLHPFVTAVIPAPSAISYKPWEWALVMRRCMDLPGGIFDHIMDYMPLPTEWNWSLDILKRRCQLQPQQSLLDMCKLMDELLADACIFKGSNQSLLLCRLNQNPQIYPYLSSEWRMPPGLISSTRVWADVQSLMHRTMPDFDVTLKPPLIRNMHIAVCELSRWSSSQSHPYKVLVDMTGSHSAANELLNRLNPQRRVRKREEGYDDDGSQHGTLETIMEQDTETEMQNDIDADDTQDDDSEVEAGAVNAQINFGLAPGTF